MSQLLIYDALSRDRHRSREYDPRREYVRRLAVLRRRQKRLDAARRSLSHLSV